MLNRITSIIELLNLLIRFISAFLVPVVFAIIIYPLIKKAKQSWHALIIIVTIFSCLILIFKGASLGINEVLAYLLGMLLGITVLSILFTARSKWLDKLPTDLTFFSSRDIRKKVHLRHIFQIAVIVEEEAKNFYYMLAEKAKDVNVKNLCRWLVGEEVRHRQLFQNMLSRWLPLSIDNRTLLSLNEELRARGVFLNPPAADASEEEMVRYAVEQEYKTVEFYLSFEKTFPRDWKRINIQTLAMEERMHAIKLIAAYPHLKMS